MTGGPPARAPSARVSSTSARLPATSITPCSCAARTAAARLLCQPRGLDGDVCRRYRLGFAPGRSALVRTRLRSSGSPAGDDRRQRCREPRRGSLVDRFYERVMFPILTNKGKSSPSAGASWVTGSPSTSIRPRPRCSTRSATSTGSIGPRSLSSRSETAIVVEGYTDAIACWEAGINNVVATLGTALTEHHVKTLTRFAKRIVYLFDGDAAGQKAAAARSSSSSRIPMDLRCVALPDDMTPTDYIAAHGDEPLRTLIDEAEPLMDFVYRTLEERSNITTPAGRAKCAGRCADAHLSAACKLYDRHVLRPDRRPARRRRGDGPRLVDGRLPRGRSRRGAGPQPRAHARPGDAARAGCPLNPPARPRRRRSCPRTPTNGWRTRPTTTYR